MIEIATMQYRRLHLLNEWLVFVQEQTKVQDVRVNIWNNSGEELSIPQGFSFPIRVFGLPGYENFGSQARFHLATHLEGTHVIYLDDDLRFGPTLVEDALRAAEEFPEDVMGNFTKQLKVRTNFYAIPMSKETHPRIVDWVGTAAMIAPLRVCQLPELREIPDPHWRVEDVYFAYFLSKIGVTCRYAALPASLRRNGKEASCFTYRGFGMEAAYEELRKDWTILCEKEKQSKTSRRLQ